MNLVASLSARCFFCAAAFLVALTALAAEPGIIVESVAKGSLAETAGIKVGDRLLSYDGKPLLSPFTLLAWEENTFDKKSVLVRLRRGKMERSVSVPLGSLGVESRPDLSVAAMRLYKQAKAAKPDEAAGLFAKAADAEGTGAGGAWLRFRSARTLQLAGNHQDAVTVFEAALHSFDKLGDDAGVSWTRWRLDDSLSALGRADEQQRNLAARLAVDQKAVRELWVAASWNVLGTVAHSRGDLDAAENWHKKALAIRERKAPDSLDLAGSYLGLGNVAYSRRDLDAAESWYKKSLAIRERKAPDSLDLAASYNNLGNVADFRGDLDAAEGWYKKALAIFERKAPDSLDLAASYGGLGIVAWSRGDLDAAEGWHKKALAIRERKAPDSLDLAYSYNNLGIVAWSRGDLDAAEGWQKKALTIEERKTPRMQGTAMTYGNLGMTMLARGEKRRAEELLRRAVEIIEAQRSTIRSGEGRGRFSSGWDWSRDKLLDAEIACEMPGEALATVQSSRGRVLADQMAARAVIAPSGAPAELSKEQAALDNDERIVRKTLERVKDPDGADARALRDRLLAILAKQGEVEAKLRAASPQYASLHPVPLTIGEIQALLEDGTLLLSFAVREKDTLLFAVTRADIKLFHIAKDEKALKEQVTSYVKRVEGTDLSAEGKALYDLLLRPAQSEIDACKRALLCPDSVLYLLPFAALVASAKENTEGRGAQVVGHETAKTYTDVVYFGDTKPLHTTISMSVYAESKKLRERKAPEQKLLAFGDPDYKGFEDDSPKRSALRGVALQRIPGTGTEVKAIAETVGPPNVVHLQEQATETAAKAESGKADIVHFACHGVLNDTDPLSSALALAKDDKNDGYLTAAEVLTDMHLNADLVVLSACRSALGEVTKDEGVAGLVRCLQFAGARCVLASLWDVQDDSGTCFMTAFYKFCKDGDTKDGALKKAMRTVRETKEWNGKQKDWSSPYYWAPFVLYGDWR